MTHQPCLHRFIPLEWRRYILGSLKKQSE